MTTVARWSGREAKALRDAKRWSVRYFAARLGIRDRTVSKWEAGWDQLIPGPDSQAMLDTVLSQASEEEKDRFRTLLTELPAQRPAPISHYVLAPPPEPGLINRSEDFTTLVSLLTSGARQDSTVAVCGPGGFGKTTLATQVCADPVVQEAFREILWVETGQGCTPARLVELISDLCVHLDGRRPALTTPEQAGFHLARVTQGRSVLIVIDNVWSAADLAPFLLCGGTRLVTTRNLRTCPATAQVMRLGPMTASQISELLTRTVAGLAIPDAKHLAPLCGGWPLLATVVGANVGADLQAGASSTRAVSHAQEALQQHGLGAFDIWDADQRSNAISHAITASLRSLDDDVRITGATALRDRYLDLVAFPAATPVPVDVLTHWWQTAHSWTAPAVRQFCRLLADRSLISAYLADRDVVIVHDVFRSYLKHLIGDQWSELHRSLIDSFRFGGQQDWTQPPQHGTYLWPTLTYHLHEAGLDHELIDVLSRPAYIAAKAAAVGTQALVDDAATVRAVDSFTDPHHAHHRAWSKAATLTNVAYLLDGLQTEPDMASTLTMALARAGHEQPDSAPDSTAAQLFCARWTRAADTTSSGAGHIGAVVSVAATKELLVSGGEDGTVRVWNHQPHARPRVLHAHTGWVYATAVAGSGDILASAGEDGQIRLWDPRTGTPIGVLTGHTRRIRSLCFTTDDRFLLSAAEDGHIHLWDIRRRRLARSMSTCRTPLWAVAVDATSSLLAAAGEDEFVRLYDPTTGELLDEAAAHRDWIRTLAFAPTGPLLASGSGDQSVIVWDTSGHRLTPRRTLDGLPSRVRAVAWDTTGLLLAATEDAVIRSFDSRGSAAHVAMPPGVDWIRTLAITADSVIAGCEDGAVRSWSPSDPRGLRVLTEGANAIWSTYITPDGAVGVLGHGDGRLEFLDLPTGRVLRTADNGTGRVWSLGAGGEYAAAAGGDGSIRVLSRADPT
ncbi:NB-ARC domain-containing protein [Nocardia sp. NBC_00881]|uniref:NB-ARC domain-containing protein n=1 Tax=Nocardia sp. NBC_00881 TaxID=2975995 RepID=UPI00386EA853|nr:NB-ARC domain-containing protein [Nocardia sp. NBC_00881]